MWKSTLSVAVLILSFSFVSLSWANPLDVDVGCTGLSDMHISWAQPLVANVECADVSDIQIALTTDEVNDEVALGGTLITPYRVGIGLAMVADLESRIDRNEESLPRPSISMFQKPEVGWQR